MHQHRPGRRWHPADVGGTTSAGAPAPFRVGRRSRGLSFPAPGNTSPPGMPYCRAEAPTPWRVLSQSRRRDGRSCACPPRRHCALRHHAIFRREQSRSASATDAAGAGRAAKPRCAPIPWGSAPPGCRPGTRRSLPHRQTVWPKGPVCKAVLTLFGCPRLSASENSACYRTHCCSSFSNWSISSICPLLIRVNGC